MAESTTTPSDKLFHLLERFKKLPKDVLDWFSFSGSRCKGCGERLDHGLVCSERCVHNVWIELSGKFFWLLATVAYLATVALALGNLVACYIIIYRTFVLPFITGRNES